MRREDALSVSPGVRPPRKAAVENKLYESIMGDLDKAIRRPLTALQSADSHLPKGTDPALDAALDELANQVKRLEPLVSSHVNMVELYGGEGDESIANTSDRYGIDLNALHAALDKVEDTAIQGVMDNRYPGDGEGSVATDTNRAVRNIIKSVQTMRENLQGG